MPEVKNPFDYQRPTEQQVQQIEAVRQKLKEAHDLILETVPASRERSLAITNLEQVGMWTNKAIVFN